MTKKAKDIMTKDVVTVGRYASIELALQLMLRNEIAGIPVVAEDGTLVGIVTEKDLLALFYEPGGLRDKVVEDFMTEPAVHFDENESLTDICKLLVEQAFRRVPVTSKGRVVGIVSRPDVLRWILQEMSRKANV
jgi:CBS domain-containing protein